MQGPYLVFNIGGTFQNFPKICSFKNLVFSQIKQKFYSKTVDIYTMAWPCEFQEELNLEKNSGERSEPKIIQVLCKIGIELKKIKQNMMVSEAS